MPNELVDGTPRFTTEYTNEYQPIVPDNSSPAASGKMASFSAAVADVVSFEFDGINVTSQHVVIQTAPLMR